MLAQEWVLKTAAKPGLPFNMDMASPTATFALKSVEIDETQLQQGEVLLETLYLSNDPAQKFWISTADTNYAKGVQPGEQIPARGIGKVLASKNDKFPVGSFVSANTNWTTHRVVSAADLEKSKVLDPKGVEHLWWYLSLLGGTAVTAYFIFYRYAELDDKRPEDHGKTFLISGAAGAVGSICVQIAAKVFGAKKIIAIAGGPEKVRHVEAMDPCVVGVDYRDPHFKENLLSHGANTVDFFIDNVGGETLDLGCTLLKAGAFILACGAISGYNNPEALVFKNYVSVITKRLTIKGLLLMDNFAKFDEAYAHLTQWIKEGKIQKENAATIVSAEGTQPGGFDQVPLIWDGLFRGANTGKLITRVKHE